VTDCRIKDEIYEMFGAEDEDVEKAMKGIYLRNGKERDKFYSIWRRH